MPRLTPERKEKMMKMFLEGYRNKDIAVACDIGARHVSGYRLELPEEYQLKTIRRERIPKKVLSDWDEINAIYGKEGFIKEWDKTRKLVINESKKKGMERLHYTGTDGHKKIRVSKVQIWK